MKIQENVALAPLTTLQVGGAARFLVEARGENDIREALRFANERSLPVFVLGGGSNLVVADTGWPGLVIQMAITDVEQTGARFRVGAGVDWDHFVELAVEQHCAGVECLSGIPGTVGGTPVQNVGAYGQDVSETIVSLDALDTKADKVVTLSNSDCGFRYRTSIFNTTEKGRYIILRVTFQLEQNGKPSTKYADLKNYFEPQTHPSLSAVREAILQIRRQKGMLIVPDDPDCRSAGSFFKNPILTAEEFQNLATRAERKGLKVPSYPALDAQRKVSAAWLVENSGFAKGFALGAAGISRKHALAIVNTGNAHASDIMRLKEEIQNGVHEQWGVSLQTEPVFVGF